MTRGSGRPGAGRRDAILKVAARLFAERGYHAIGMAELGEATGLGRGTLYHYIKSKEDLLHDIAREYIADLVEAAERTLQDEAEPAARLRMLGRELIEKIASHQAELTVCFRELHSLSEPWRTEVLELHRRYEAAWRDTMQEGAEAGVFRPYDPIVLKGVLGMYFYSYLWLRAEDSRAPVAIADRLNDLAIRMLVPAIAASSAGSR
ncbi:TetR/AcrR family transcriptional regulator [Billgrantia pellis]|uniref:TetR/AcrR family transcriptional regulator n=1 Tax=Billgrantia pellis TaxID=2606936 RepID=A0A7V7FXQ1_9GAMM|nr:TetR/AcrR family transcriptional regulator [Halomonas pellis]KAA0009971.1 TetR/AcrR family transcriptional regulator [Halomonas pellis]